MAHVGGHRHVTAFQRVVGFIDHDDAAVCPAALHEQLAVPVAHGQADFKAHLRGDVAAHFAVGGHFRGGRD